MKVKDDYILKEIAGNYTIIPTGKESLNFNRVMTLNEVGAFLFKKLQNEINRAELVDELLSQYSGVSREQAEKDVEEFIVKLIQEKIID